jgi:hypothetical protein
VSVEAQFHRPAEKRKHPVDTDLVGGVDLTPKALRDREGTGALADLLANAEYWLAFEVAHFEPLLATCPSPLRELGVGIALRYTEGIDGQLAMGDIEAARAHILPGLPEDVRHGIEAGLESLERAVRVRESLDELTAQGFEPHTHAHGISLAGLRAAGRATIAADGKALEKEAVLAIGVPIELSSTDDRGKATAPPDVENDLGAPLLSKSEDHSRTIVLLVPGKYRLRVPGKAEGVRTILAR